MYGFITHTWNPIKRKLPHSFRYYYVYKIVLCGLNLLKDNMEEHIKHEKSILRQTGEK